jgi:hypothetical protein
MPYVLEIKKHNCDLPYPIDAATEYESGTLWQCSDCGTVYVLTNDQRDGWIWISKGKYTMPYIPRGKNV